MEACTFAEKLALARRRKGWTQGQLSTVSGLSGAAISRLERGAAPSWQDVQALSDALGVPLDDLRDAPADPARDADSAAGAS